MLHSACQEPLWCSLCVDSYYIGRIKAPRQRMPLKIMLRDDITLMTKFQFQCFVYEVTMTLESHSGRLKSFWVAIETRHFNFFENLFSFKLWKFFGLNGSIYTFKSRYGTKNKLGLECEHFIRIYSLIECLPKRRHNQEVFAKYYHKGIYLI